MKSIRDDIREILERSTNATELANALDRISLRTGHQVRLRANGDVVRIGVGRAGWHQTEWLEWHGEGWRCSEPSDARYPGPFELLVALFDLDTRSG